MFHFLSSKIHRLSLINNIGFIWKPIPVFPEAIGIRHIFRVSNEHRHNNRKFHGNLDFYMC